ncbi:MULTISPECIES: energy transducer TonB [unclassified Marinimicrobium]|uniref:energy transducer TonB n=1 Tax=Marinimicrobium TaxID=359337 RepID=UPI000C464B8A|nr:MULTISPECIES: energy transducer TonB [unclassified Marinimicrobium]MAN52016.1 energy transducer TonB [Marinimicrobium sp.]
MDSAIFIELLDTSLKVALGALIAGVAGWWVMRRNAIVGSRSPQENRKLSLLEDVSGQVGRVTHTFAKYSSLAAESIQFGKRWPKERRAELEQISAELVNEFKGLADAEAKLLMLGENNLERSLRLYGSQIAQFRKQVYAGREDISLEQIAAFKKEVARTREKFYELLSRKYDRLLANA